MGEEQIRLVWKDAAESLFRLRIQGQTEKLASPSEKRKHRHTIARCQTILTQRGLLKGGVHAPIGPLKPEEETPQHEKHAKKPRASGRGKLRAAGKEGTSSKRQVRKRNKSGT